MMCIFVSPAQLTFPELSVPSYDIPVMMQALSYMWGKITQLTEESINFFARDTHVTSGLKHCVPGHIHDCDLQL